MYAVGKVGSLISRTVSAPFHPVVLQQDGGAVDVVVVQQQDGGFKSSPWYVRFGKFQGVLKTSEKVVSISVNGVEAGFHMYLDSVGEAYFLSDADPGGEEWGFILSPASSGDEQEAPPTLRKSKSTSCDSSTMEADVMGNKILARTNTSRQTTILERMFGRKSVMHSSHPVDRVSSRERAEITAELLDTKWAANLSRGSRSHNSNE
jgi:phosphatidate phosphatase LPIN